MPEATLPLLKNENSIFDIVSAEGFRDAALAVFRHQFHHNEIYGKWCRSTGTDVDSVKEVHQIPFLPIGFFRTHRVITGTILENPLVFTSSGTTGSVASKHLVADPRLYEQSFARTFRLFYGDPRQYCILALLPGYLERPGSSLVYMMERLVKQTGHPHSGFFLHDKKSLVRILNDLKAQGQKAILVGVSYALLDLCALKPKLGMNTIVMETGGMKGTRKEMLKEELHATLTDGLQTENIHSEYGMTELLSQAYSRGGGLFETPPWMRFLIRETDDPFSMQQNNRTGGVNVIDLANIHSCAFVATQDLGRINTSGKLELAGRFDHSDIRGCNLMIQGF